jgi:hypothetical protein
MNSVPTPAPAGAASSANNLGPSSNSGARTIQRSRSTITRDIDDYIARVNTGTGLLTTFVLFVYATDAFTQITPFSLALASYYIRMRSAILSRLALPILPLLPPHLHLRLLPLLPHHITLV